MPTTDSFRFNATALDESPSRGTKTGSMEVQRAKYGLQRSDFSLPFETTLFAETPNSSASARWLNSNSTSQHAAKEVESSACPMPLSLPEIEALALQNNPALAAARATVAKAAGLRHQVGVRANPRLGYSGQQLADRSTDQHSLFLEQEFVRGNKLKLNQQVLCQTERAQSAELLALEFRVLTDLRIRFYQAVAAQLEMEASRQFLEVASRGVGVAEDRQKAGEGTLIETLQAQTLLSEITLSVQRAQLAYEAAWRDLTAIAGIPETMPTQLASELNVPDRSRDWQNTFLEIIAQSPEIAAAQAIVGEKQAMLQRQQAQAIPNLTGQLGSGYDAATNHGMINVQVSAPLPINNLNRGNIAAAQADLNRAMREVERIQQTIRSRLARTAQEYELGLATVQRYEQEIIPQTGKSLELSEDAYRKGELDFLQVLIVRRSYYESTIRMIQAKSELAQAAAMVDGLLLHGGLDSPRDFTSGDSLREQSFGAQ